MNTTSTRNLTGRLAVAAVIAVPVDPGGRGNLLRSRLGAAEGVAMKIGMLWFDNDPNADLATKVRRAADYYKTKYSRVPSVCFVNPKDAVDGIESVYGCKIKANRSVMPNHLWMGIES